jgi:hypothetical protein
MAWRAIQDTVPASESLASVSHFAERLYWRIVSQADAWGRLPGTERKVGAVCVPLLGVREAKIGEALDELIAVGRIVVYCEQGIWTCEVTDWDRNQPRDVRGRNGRRFQSRFPARTDASEIRPPCSRNGAARRSAARVRVAPPESESEVLLRRGS